MNMTGDPTQQNGANFFAAVNYSLASAGDCPKFPNQPTVSSNAMFNPPFRNFADAFPPQQPVRVPPDFPQPNVAGPSAAEAVSFPAPTAPLSSYCFGPGDGRPQVAPVQFPFPVASTSTAGGDFGCRGLHVPLRCKRKTDSPPPPAAKQHITDEKMAEHMAQLHINSESVTCAVEPETQPAREKRLYMCEEMRRLQQDSILPQALLNRIARPCTAVVLWTPPQRLHVPLPPVENNNEEGETDNNVMDLDSVN